MARSYTAGVHISAPLIILLICSLLDRGRTQQQMSTPYQTFYQGLEVLTKAAKVAAFQDFAPFNQPTKNASLQYWNSVLSICPLVDQRSEVKSLLSSETTNAATSEVEAMQSIADNVLIDACEWMNSTSGTPEGFYNCSSSTAAALSIDSLCVFMEVNEKAKKAFMNIRRSLHPNISTSGGKQKKWIESTFSGHAQASTVLPILKIVPRYSTCQVQVGSVIC